MGERHALGSAGAVAFLVVVAAPVGYFAARVLGAFTGAEAAAALALLTRPATWRAVGFTVLQAAASAAISLVVGLPGAYLVAHHRFPLRRIARALLLVPFVLPSIIVVICMVSFWGRGGLVSRLTGVDSTLVYSFAGILMAHVFYNVSLVVRIVGEGWEAVDPRLGECAASLGDRRTGVFFRVTLPLLGPSLATAFFLVFLYSFLSFGVVLVFGGARWATLEVLIYREMYVTLDMPRAVVFAGLQLVLSLGFLLLANRSIGRFELARTGAGRGAQRTLAALAPAPRILLAIYGVIFLTLVLGPILTMVARAFSPRGHPSLDSFRMLFGAGGPVLSQSVRDVEGILRSSVPRVVGGSLLMAATAGTLAFVAALVFSLAQGRQRAGWRDAALALPLGLSVVTTAIGVDLLSTDLGAPSALRAPLVALVQAFVAFPVVYRVVRGAVASLPARYLESARSLGAGRVYRALSVELPLLRRGLANGYAYGLAIAFADFTVAMTVGHGDVVTFPVAVYRLIGFRSFDLGLALGVVYLGLCLLLFVLIDATNPERRLAA
jgi:thiamine transport system permease protein